MFILNPWILALCLATGTFWVVGPIVYAICGTGSAQLALNIACMASLLVAVAFFSRFAIISERVKARTRAGIRSGK